MFVHAPDPDGNGYVASLARPGGNATGFLSFEYNLAGKLVELLKEIAPTLTRASVLRDAAVAFSIGQFAAIQSVAPSLDIDLMAINLRDAAEIERDIASLAQAGSAGLILIEPCRPRPSRPDHFARRAPQATIMANVVAGRRPLLNNRSCTYSHVTGKNLEHAMPRHVEMTAH